MYIATVTSKGQVTIPKEIRHMLALRAGDRIMFTPTADGGVIIRAKKLPFERLIGMLSRPSQYPVSVEQMDEGIARHLKRKHPKR